MKKSVCGLGALCMAAFISTGAAATDLEDYLIRQDFVTGKSETFLGPNSTLTKNPLFGVTSAKATYGMDGAGTAFHPCNAWGEVFGENDETGLLNVGDWSVAVSVRAGAVEGGVIFSIGRLNSAGKKEVALCSSSENGKLYLKVLTRNDEGSSVESSTEITGLSDTTTSFHAAVLSFTRTAVGKGTLTLYWDGALVATVTTTTDMIFGNAFQYCRLLSISGKDDHAALGCADMAKNTALSFQDMRLFTCALTAADAMAYATLYPSVLPDIPFSPLDSYANIQSFADNAIDTGYYAQPLSKFIVDFQFTAIKGQSRIFGARSTDNTGLANGFYINGTKTGSGNFACIKSKTQSGNWDDTGLAADTLRRIATIASTDADEGFTTDIYTYDRTSKHTYTGDSGHANPANQTTLLFAEWNNSGTTVQSYAGKSKIFSFEADDDNEGIPAIFLAPTVNDSGEAGFLDLVTGAFHGEARNASTPLQFNDGIGRAEDYRYRSGKLYSRCYISSAGETAGLVRFEGGEAAAVDAQYVVRGRTTTVSAVPAEGFDGVVWSGDTWAIENGSIYDTTIDVKNERAAHLAATFFTMDSWSAKVDNAFDTPGNWSGNSAPAAGDSVYLTVDGETEIALNADHVLGLISVQGEGSLTFTGTGSISASLIKLASGISLTQSAQLRLESLDIESGAAAVISDLDGIKARGIIGEGTLELNTGERESADFSTISDFTGDLKVVFNKSIGIENPAALSLKSFTAIGLDNTVLTLSGSEVRADIATVENGVLRQGSDFILGDTPKLVVKDGATFDINALKVDDATIPHIAGAGAGDWPWALVSSAGAMAAQNYLNGLTLTADATIGGPGQFKIGLTKAGAEFALDGNTLVYDGDSFLTCRNLASTEGVIRIVGGGTMTLYGSDNLNTAGGDCSDTKLILENGATLVNKTEESVYVSELVMDGGAIEHTDGIAVGPLSTLSGWGTVDNLAMPLEGAAFKPDGRNHLTILDSITGKILLDCSSIQLSNAMRVPLFKAPSSLTATILGSIDPSRIPERWKLHYFTNSEGVTTFNLVRPGFVISIN